ncbi:DEAD/DEAH box helicase [Opitutus terrae]|uniref:Non-specific serine/threonine protein kinase n=1 Tax=Opitutus terrae (strain DSM 11246 / JCM 15787 / PB90-1) TaxID=452637 RepID=B1ZVB6_OPITP|nr:DEAD/DEAH box helicase [Opitutus terrae]ACB76783.1 Non-specific serine/threonine protein kinase [Opitutus terrae PB90-1]
MLRLHLPPNLAAAAGRNAVALKVDLDLRTPPAPELLPILALLQRWCGTPTPPKFLQLTRAQLRELADATGDQPVFWENGQPTTWQHDEFIVEPISPVADLRSSSSDIHAPNPKLQTPNSKLSGSGSASPPITVDGSEHFLAMSLPSREHPAYAEIAELLKSNGFLLEPSNRKWWLRDRHKTLNFLATHGARLREEFGAQFTANFQKNTARILPAEITCEATPVGADFNVTVALRAGSASDDALRSALTASRGYVEADGKVFLLDAAKVRQLDAAQHALAGTPAGGSITRRTHRVTAARAAEAEGLLETLSPDFQPPAEWRTRSEALRQLTRLQPAPLPATLESQLRPYQRLGAAWLWHLYRHELGGILADEMGLGKTLQALALLTAVNRAAPTARTSLVVCPASLLENWRRESARFAPSLRVFVHHGAQRLAEPAAFARHDLVVTSYGTLTRDWELFTRVRFETIIADEAQHIKNRRSQNAAALRSLLARSRFLLTGTPLENSLDDLRSLFEFLLPGYVDPLPPGVRADERAWFDERLRARVAPYLLRRTKSAVAPELPAKLEQILWCELSPAQASLYRATQQRLERELFDLEAGGASEAKLRFAALTQLLRLRQICCDPRLVEWHGRPAHDHGRDARATPDAPGPQLSTLNSQLSLPPPTLNAQPSAPLSAPPPFPDSAKLDAFRELLAEAVDDGHRVLVFSQFTSLLALLREELAVQETAHCYLDGSMPPRARQAEVDRFQNSPDIPVFLISLKAGGTGLNLTAADTVVHFDPWWNPAAEAQATDRAHRIGQSRIVTSYKLIASGTVEEKVLALQEEKRALLAGVFEASDAVAAQLSLSDLKALLH